MADAEDPRARYDLTSHLAGQLDLHMVLLLVAHLQEKGFYRSVDLVEATLQYLSGTRMSDYYLEIAQEHSEAAADAAEEMKRKRDDTLEELSNLEGLSGPLLEILRDEETLQRLQSEDKFTLEHLREEYEIDMDTVEAFYRYGKVNYEIGNYIDTIVIMLSFRELAPDHELAFKALWGKLAGEILMMSTRETVVSALKDAYALQKIIDQQDEASDGSSVHHLELLAFRSWLLTWSLFIFFKNPVEDDEEGASDVGSEYPRASEMPEYLRMQMIEFFMNQKHLNALQMNCPWLLRYLCVAVIIAQKKSRKFKGRLINAVQQERYQYQDPITNFVVALYIDYNFDAANDCLQESQIVLENDYFLAPITEEFMTAARLAIIESVCKIHTKLETGTLAARINLDQSLDAEQWIVDLIRDIKLDAKLDSEKQCIVMNAQMPEVHQMVIDRTKDLAYRTYQLTNEVQQQGNPREQIQ